jgi:ABC toxin-like protein
MSNDYSKDKFDLEWQWLGAFTTWRAARFVFGYPENYLLPSLRPPRGTPQGPSQAFAGPEGLVQKLREMSRLTPVLRPAARGPISQRLKDGTRHLSAAELAGSTGDPR